MVNTDQSTATIVVELDALRARLKAETVNEATLRQAYEAACRPVPGDDATLLAAKQRLDLAIARIDGMRNEIARKDSLLDEMQGREAEESLRNQIQTEFERASEKLVVSQAELAKLRAEYAAFPEKIRQAQWCFHEALRAFQEAKQRSKVF